MAASSSDKTTEKQQGAAQPAQKKKNLHVALPTELIERLKHIQNWGERFRWTYDEDKIRRVWEIQQNMDFDELFHYVMYGDGEEVVWDDDVWNLQQITKVPNQPQSQSQSQSQSHEGEEMEVDDDVDDDDDEKNPTPDKPKDV